MDEQTLAARLRRFADVLEAAFDNSRTEPSDGAAIEMLSAAMSAVGSGLTDLADALDPADSGGSSSPTVESAGCSDGSCVIESRPGGDDLGTDWHRPAGW